MIQYKQSDIIKNDLKCFTSKEYGLFSTFIQGFINFITVIILFFGE